MKDSSPKGSWADSAAALWIVRLAVALVFIINVQCAVLFLLVPENYLVGFELSGLGGRAALQGLAIAFLMWNATYPLVIVHPFRFRAVYAIVLAQQAIGLMGESLLYGSIGAGHELLQASILRFIIYDGAGLVVMGAAFLIVLKKARLRREEVGCAR